MSRIAILTPYAPPVPGGISSFVGGLSRVLTAAGHDVSILAGEGGSEPQGSNLGTDRTYVRAAVPRLQQLRPDVVHAHSHFHCLAAGWRYRRAARSSRLVFSFHTTTVPPIRQPFVSLLNRADVVTFVSATQLAFLREALRLGGDFRVLRPATDLPNLDSLGERKSRDSYGLDGAFPILAFAGPLEYAEKVRGVVDLVSSLTQIRARYPTAKVLVIGDGTLRSAVTKAARGSGDSVTITGFVEDPRTLMAAADLYCHISYQEGLPIALLEAMSVGSCVIASPVGGIPEVIDGENGVLVSDGPNEIARVVCDLAGNAEERHKLGMAARQTIERSYTWAARLQQISSVYGLG